MEDKASVKRPQNSNHIINNRHATDIQSWASNPQHTAGDLKKSLHGNDYQLKLLMLFASKCRSQVAFRLATEMDAAEKFDDLVFRYTDSNGNIKYRFLQAKHRQFLTKENKIKVSDLKSASDDNDFSLQKYFVSYVKDIRKEEFKDGQPEDFIICTNTDFDFQPSTKNNERQKTKDDIKKKWKGYFSEKTDTDKVLNLGGKHYQFSVVSKIREKIVQELKPIFEKALLKNNLPSYNTEKISEFLDKLLFAVGQPSGANLEQHIKDELGNEFNLINDTVYNDFFQYMYNWMQHRLKDDGERGKGRAHFLTHDDVNDLFQSAKETIASLGLISSTLLCKRKIEEFGLRFKEDIKTVQKIENFLSNQSSEQILIICSKTGLLSKIKVSQILLNDNTNNYIYSDLTHLSLLVGSCSDPVEAFKSKKKDYLIIEIDFLKGKDAAENLLIRFYEIVMKEPKKKIILITRPDLKDNILDLFQDKMCATIIDDDNNKLCDLTPQSKDKILDTEITIFGEKKKLSSLTTDASKNVLYSVIDGDALTTLINSDSNIIGTIHEYAFDTYIDIPRTFTYQTKIDKECFKENKNDLFAVSGIEKDEFSQLVPEKERIRTHAEEDPDKETQPIRFIALDSHCDIQKDFKQLCNIYEGHTIHLLEKRDDALEWKQSRGSLIDLRRFVLMEGGQNKQIKDLTGSAIVVGEAGNGKSTILTTCSMETKSLWNIRINLKDYEMHIDRANFGNLDGIVKFLSNVIDPASSKISLIQSLLKHCLTQQDQVLLLLDGYDEVKERHQGKIVRLLKTLKIESQGKALLTTRSYARSELEDALGIFAYSLNPFVEKEQKEFLKQFWISRLNVKEPSHEEKIEEFTKEILKHFHELNLMKKEGLVGIVLQARMVAEMFETECKKYLAHKEFNLSKFKISNIYDLYEGFIEYQHQRYLEGRIEISQKLGENSRTSLTSVYTKAHGYFALKSLFSKDQIQRFLGKQNFSKEELQGVGLIKTFKDDSADFIHPSYAEYFAADFLVGVLEKEKDHPKYRAVDKFLLTHIFRDQNKVIRDFLKGKIEKKSDDNLNSKWKGIQDCDLLGEVGTEVILHLDSEHLNTADADVVSKESLNDLRKDVENCMNWIGDYYYYNGDSWAEFINKLFRKFLSETDIEELKTTLKFLLKVNGKSHYHIANAAFSSKNNIGRAVIHYLTQVKQQQGSLECVKGKLRADCVKEVIGKEYFFKFQEILKLFFDHKKIKKKKEMYLNKFINFLIPESVESIERLIGLNDLHYISDIFYPPTILEVKSYIRSAKDIQKQQYKTRIINSLKSIHFKYAGSINRELDGERDLESLQAFIIDILFHPSVIADTKISINEIYEHEINVTWIERQGVLISRVLKTLTPEMSKRFNSVLDCTDNIAVAHIYTDAVFVDLIVYIVNRARVEELPQVDKLAFLTMLVYFVGFKVKISRKFPFTIEQLETTLKLVKDLLNEQRQPTLVVSESIEYLLILGKAGLKLIDTEKELLVLDPASKFQYKLSSVYGDEIIELIKWKIKNDSKSRKEFLEKCYEIVELKKRDLKRKRNASESDLQMFKKLRIELHGN